jgi:hypothetical protein
MGKLDGRCLCGAVTYSSDAVAPQAEIAADSAQPWSEPHESRPRFPRGPAGQRGH